MPILEEVKIDYNVTGVNELSKARQELEATAKAGGNIGTSIKSSSDQFDKSAKQVTQSSTGLKSTVSSIGPAIVAAFSVTALIGFGKQIISVTAEFQKLEAVLTNTLGSKGKAQDALALIKQFAAETNFSVVEITQSFVKLANQGFVPTRDELRKLADLANSTGKSFDQLTEAILDAQTGQFERLKEFGIKAEKQGDQVIFTFKGVRTQVAYTSDAMKEYILSLGDLNGVAGSTAAISETLGGKISNLGDAFDKLLNSIGSSGSGVLSGFIDILSKFVNSFAESIEFISNPAEYARKAAKEEYDKAVNDQKEFYKDKDSLERQVEIQTIQNLIKSNKNITEAQLKLARIKVSALALLEQEATESEKKKLENAANAEKELTKAQLRELEKRQKQQEDAWKREVEASLRNDKERRERQDESYKKTVEFYKAEATERKKIDRVVVESSEQSEQELADFKQAMFYKSLQDFIDTSNKQLIVAQATSNIIGSLIQITGDRTGELAEFQKVVALIQIGISTAKAIAEGVASAQDVPYPGNLVAVATTVATVLANVAQAKQILEGNSQVPTFKMPSNAKGYATGVIDLRGPGTTTSDSIPAMLSVGESVMTAYETKKYRPVLDAIRNDIDPELLNRAANGKTEIDYNKLASAIVRGNKSLPLNSFSFDENGYNHYLIKGISRKQIINRRYKGGV